MTVAIWIWLGFVFAVGCCIGSFLNVVIYRVPRDKSLIGPGSACPACNTPIQFYDNIPLVSWLVLGRRCRYCKAPISPRYFVIELLSGLLFVAVFVLYFVVNFRYFEIDGQAGIDCFLHGGWAVYFAHTTMLAAFLAASAIDLELWVIPVSICWFVTAVGLAASAFSVYLIEPRIINYYGLFPAASAKTSAMAAGAGIGLAISLLLLHLDVIQRSYESEQTGDSEEAGKSATETACAAQSQNKLNHRMEVLKEVVFLLPIVVCAGLAYLVLAKSQTIADWWLNFLQIPAVKGFLGSLWGYFCGGAVVWVTRIFGTLAFGKEAMGLGDVHLMAAAGTIIGPAFTVIAFFIAPFFGLGWAFYQMIFKKTRQIPYGPFLSLGVFIVMIWYDEIFRYLHFLVFR